VGEQNTSTDWQNKIASCSFRALESIQQLLDDEEAISEPAVLRYFCLMARPKHALYLGNSMPVRDANTYAPGRRDTYPVIANRGASGIDGNIATAFGYGQGSRKRMTIVLGDIAALHDLNSLALLKHANPPVTVVIINNDGGGVFHFLPIAEEDASFERYFGTPHGLTFERAAAQFGLAYHAPASMTELVQSHEAAMESNASALIEVQTDRRENLRFHREILEAVRKAIDEFE
jgi:2-succinyl-5-enolpyruvyl-6-hydroxy-3-cyclohexene-1-carboxylate synthase